MLHFTQKETDYLVGKFNPLYPNFDVYEFRTLMDECAKELSGRDMDEFVQKMKNANLNVEVESP